VALLHLGGWCEGQYHQDSHVLSAKSLPVLIPIERGARLPSNQNGGPQRLSVLMPGLKDLVVLDLPAFRERVENIIFVSA
jgi:hypothetical protein